MTTETMKTIEELLREWRIPMRFSGLNPDNVAQSCADELQPIADALAALEPDLDMLRSMAKNCLTRWANPRNREICEEQLHTPDVYEAIVRCADAISRITGVSS